jgi:hypothetical protein
MTDLIFSHELHLFLMALNPNAELSLLIACENDFGLFLESVWVCDFKKIIFKNAVKRLAKSQFSI